MASVPRPPTQQRKLDEVFVECVELAKKLDQQNFGEDLKTSVTEINKFMQLFIELYQKKDQMEVKIAEKILDHGKKDPIARKLLASPKEVIGPLKQKLDNLLLELKET